MALTEVEASRELRTIRGMPYGIARTAAAEAIARRIEAEGPKSKLAEALLDLVEAYTFFADAAKSFVVFARLLRLWDESPESFDEADQRNLHWEFKWVAGDLPDYPEITAAQAEAFLTDMERRFDLAGHGKSSVAMSRFRWAWHAGSGDAEAARLAWVTCPRDEFDDCMPCTVGQQVDYLTEAGRSAEAIRVGETRQGSCNLEPTRTLHALSLAYLNAGRPADGVVTYRQALAALDPSDSDYAPARGQGFEFLARGGQVERALRHLRDDHPQLLVKASTPLFRLRFLLGVLAGLSANLDRADLPTGLRNVPAPTIADLHSWVHAEVSALARQFDARGGTDYYARLLARSLAATRTPDVLDFGAPVAPEAEPAAAAVVAAGRPGADGSAEPTKTAEELADAGEHHLAARAYESAAEQAQAAGLLEDAGLAWAEAAHCAELAGDDDGAHTGYANAVPRLQAAGTGDELLAQVVSAWAPVASRMADTAGVLDLLAAIIDRLAEPDIDGLSEELAASRQRTAARLRASMRDTFARTVGATAAESRVPGRDLPAAIREATRAGEEFAGLSMIADAAHAFWIAGRLQREARDIDGALWSLESAYEGFTAARLNQPRIEAAGEFIELLREAGQPDRADQVVASLTD